jgi:glutamyl endopeptidase
MRFLITFMFLCTTTLYAEGWEPSYSGTLDDDTADYKVFYPDERKQVTNLTAFPYRVMGLLRSNSGRCTGTLIGARHVLTAAHCVYDIKTNKWASDIRFTSASKDKTIRVVRSLAITEYTKKHDINWDFALLILAEDYGSKVGWLGYGYTNGAVNSTINIAGFPADKSNYTMWRASCKIDKATSFLNYKCDTYGGMSGASVYEYRNSSGQRIIVGIHKGSTSDSNYAVKINKTIYDKLKKWIAEY